MNEFEQQDTGQLKIVPNMVLLNRFKILKMLGQGSQAQVFQALDIKQKRMVAIKHYHHIDFLSKKDIEYIDREVSMLLTIKSVNIMRCYQEIRILNSILLILEYIDGSLLSSFIKKQFPCCVDFEKLIDVSILYSRIKPLEKSVDLRYQYQSIIRELLKDKVCNKNVTIHNALPTGYVVAKQDSIQFEYEKVDENQQITASNSEDSTKQVECESQKVCPMQCQSYYESLPHLLNQLANVLVELDKIQIMHRDLKPDNIMITPQMCIKLIDFGFSRQSKSGQTLVGTEGFIAPEVHLPDKDTRNYTNRVDIWSMGAIIFELLFGYVPYLRTKNMLFEIIQAMNGLYLPPNLYGFANVNDFYIEAIERCFEVDPSKRCSACELRDILYKIKSPFNDNVKSTDAKTNNTVKQNSKCVSIKCVLLGDFGVGKTTLLKRMAQYEGSIKQIIHKKVEVNVEQKQYSVDIQFHDTLGTEQRQNSMVPSIVRGSNLVYLVYKLGNKESFEVLDMWKQHIINYCDEGKVHVRIIGIQYDNDESKDYQIQNIDQYQGININKDSKVSEVIQQDIEACIKKQCYNFEQQLQVKKSGFGCCK